jgi:hypothetical protein
VPPDSFVGVEESPKPQAAIRKPGVTIVRGVLRLRDCHPVSAGETGGCTQPVLLDISGRSVMDLAPGANDVRHLAPGVYFVQQTSDVEHHASSVTKVIVTR